MSIDVAVIPAAGRGTRMRPATRVVPKALITVVDRPQIQYSVEEAARAGAKEAILVRDGVALEGSHTSFFAVFGGEVRTAPLTNYVLPGITRRAVLTLCSENGIPARETPVFVEQLEDADELFLAGTTAEAQSVAA